LINFYRAITNKFYPKWFSCIHYVVIG